MTKRGKEKAGNLSFKTKEEVLTKAKPWGVCTLVRAHLCSRHRQPASSGLE